jgi:hypothetical protein
MITTTLSQPSRKTAFSNALAVSIRTAGIATATRRLAPSINVAIFPSDIETKTEAFMGAPQITLLASKSLEISTPGFAKKERR